MIRTAAVTLAVLAAIDHLKFGGTYTRIAEQIAHNIVHFLL
jgi:hypothetical protein